MLNYKNITLYFSGSLGEAILRDWLKSANSPPPPRVHKSRVLDCTPSRFTGSTSTRRVIPCLDVKGGRVVKGVSFEGLRDAGDPVELAKEYQRQGADELVMLDISASIEDRKTSVNIVSRIL